MRLRAALIGLGLDGSDDHPVRIITGKECLVFGGSEQTQEEMLETVQRLECELERLGRQLGEVTPDDLAEIAWRIDSPELHAIALRLESGLASDGLAFEQTDADRLTELAIGTTL
jgi:hypothetical protein